MKGLLLLFSVGVALYALLVVTHDVSPSGSAEDTSAGQTRPGRQEHQSSWGSYLPDRSRTGTPIPATSQPFAPSPQGDASQNSERKPGAEYKFASPAEKATSSVSESTEADPVEWVKVVLAARVHSQASVSSRSLRFYRPDTELQVVGRENGWAPAIRPGDPGARLGL